MAAPVSKSVSLVQLVEIASPCTASWDEMQGDDRSRFCSHCKLNVYNLAVMTEQEAERLIIEKEGKLCTKIHRRADGTVITRDCPVGLRAVRRRMAWAALKAVAAVLAIAAVVRQVVTARSATFDYERWKKAGVPASPPPPFHQVRAVVGRWLDSSAPQPMQIIMGRANRDELAAEIEILLQKDNVEPEPGSSIPFGERAIP